MRTEVQVAKRSFWPSTWPFGLIFGLSIGCTTSPPGEHSEQSDDDDDSHDGSSDDSHETSEDPSTSNGGEETSVETPQDPSCVGNQRPQAPAIIEPAAGRNDIVAESLELLGSDFIDPDSGDRLREIEAEIWGYDQGKPTDRVWSARVESSKVRALKLSDGQFDGGAQLSLAAWTDYRLRMRYRDHHQLDQLECSIASPWSEDRLFRTDDGSSPLFDENVIRDVYLEIPQESWEAIDAQAIPPECAPFTRDYHRGTLKIEGEVFDGVGVKIKGGCGSARTLEQKASFKVNLEWDDPDADGCGPEREFLGIKKLTLNNAVQDHSALHERLGYYVYRQLGLPAPRAAHVRLFVNDELWGLYVHVETIDRRFLRRWFESNQGELYEGTYWCDLLPSNVPPDEDESGKFCLSSEFTPDDCDAPPLASRDLTPLRDMVNEVEALIEDDFYPDIANLFNYDRFLTTWALESVIGHWDGYMFEPRNNYRVYFEPTSSEWTLLSSGIDQIFVQDQDPWQTHGILASECLNDSACEKAFIARLAAVNDAVEKLDLPERAQDIRQHIADVVDEDPRKEYSVEDFQEEQEKLLEYLRARPDQIRQYIAEHEDTGEETDEDTDEDTDETTGEETEDETTDETGETTTD